MNVSYEGIYMITQQVRRLISGVVFDNNNNIYDNNNNNIRLTISMHHIYEYISLKAGQTAHLEGGGCQCQ